MKNYIKMSIIILVILFIAFTIMNLSKQFTGKITDEPDYSFTKAICDESNYCQDYEITCKDNKTISINPITGAIVQFSEDWVDPRDEETIDRLCGGDN